ncbi:hypothetical protein IGI04_007277 [Brassica rapa subsp. trilocularis]|uniref:Uncharacterized protein n=1 Tax=Brassica rapa subsp. trilocularis TaxID=1813537 RepID=A0ABQ7NJ92_BRACM|nr:hypothetical protein IGI04_007277 [Brassica rapa subsp. trilocularis]
MKYEPPRDWWGVRENAAAVAFKNGRVRLEAPVRLSHAESWREGVVIHCKGYRLHPREPDAECTRAGGSTGTQQEKGRVGPLELYSYEFGVVTSRLSFRIEQTISGSVDGKKGNAPENSWDQKRDTQRCRESRHVCPQPRVQEPRLEMGKGRGLRFRDDLEESDDFGVIWSLLSAELHRRVRCIAMDGDLPTVRLSPYVDTRYIFELAFQCHRFEVNQNPVAEVMPVLLKSGQSASREEAVEKRNVCLSMQKS